MFRKKIILSIIGFCLCIVTFSNHAGALNPVEELCKKQAQKCQQDVQQMGPSKAVSPCKAWEDIAFLTAIQKHFPPPNQQVMNAAIQIALVCSKAKACKQGYPDPAADPRGYKECLGIKINACNEAFKSCNEVAKKWHQT